MSNRPRRLSSTSISANHEDRIRRLEAPRDPPWMYWLPIAPAATPDDYIAGYAGYAPFESPWVNLGVDANGRAVPASAYRIFEGKLQVRFFCTGGEFDAPSLIGTLPDGFRPPALHPLDVVMGEDKLDRGTIEIRDNGEVWFLGFLFGTGGT